MVPDPRAPGRTGRVRRLNEPRPAAVEANSFGTPLAVLLKGRYLRVREVHDSWRIDDEWWREEITRRYFEVALDGGQRATLYHDLACDIWFAQMYDKPRDRESGRKDG